MTPLTEQVSLRRIGVFGSASNRDPEAKQLAMAVGEAIAKHNVILVTGATTGIPYYAGKAALRKGGFVLGISPASNPEEHVQVYGKPLDGCSIIVWTGLGYTGRNCLNLRNCDGAIFIGGETGTLQEFSIGHYEGKVLGVLKGSGGITDRIESVLEVCPTNHGSTVIFDDNPKELVKKVVNRIAASKK